MDGITFRNDDVSANSIGLNQFYDVIDTKFPDSTIYSCTTVFSKSSNDYKQSVYPALPLKNQEFNYFLDVDRCEYMGNIKFEFPNVQVVSHGLWHFDHTQVESQLMKASIVSSCKLLHTDIFVPPFNRWNAEMELVCAANNITMIKSDQEGWKSFEHNKFDPEHKLWYFHSWRWTPQTLKEYLCV